MSASFNADHFYDIANVEDGAWKLLLLLRKVVKLVCAPKISTAQVLYLNRLVKLCVEKRMSLFPDVPLQPKHHYLLYYPGLIIVFGPLVHVWTMRMKRKHTFFKRYIRSMHNFINFGFLCAASHKSACALQNMADGFPPF